MEYFLEFFEDFLNYITSPAHKSPLDFFTWHSYLTIEKNISYAEYARKALDSYGFTETENILNEWNMGPNLRGTLKDASYISGMICAMQNTPLDKMMYYDAQVHANYGGLFDPVHHTVFKSYYAFQAFNELYRLKNQVECSEPDQRDVIAVAAADSEYQEGAVVVTNMNAFAVTAELSLHFPNHWNAPKIHIFAVDAQHDLTETGAASVSQEAERAAVTLELPAHSFYLIKISV